MFCLRRSARTSSLLLAAISPFWTCPCRVLPSQRNTLVAMYHLVKNRSVIERSCAIASLRGGARITCFQMLSVLFWGRLGPRKTRSTQHLYQFLHVGRPADAVVIADLFLYIQVIHRLVQRQHAELRLAGLHDGVNLVDLVFTDEAPDGGIRNHDFDREDPASAGL